jgi:3-methyladenine DNA glycosylase/8-oxoguanine DNA glycosylase
VTRAEIPLDGPLDLQATLGPLARGPRDPSIRFTSDGAWLALRRVDGPVAVHVSVRPERVTAEAWGPGAAELDSWFAGLLGMGPGMMRSGDLVDAPDRVIADLARRRPGIRIPASQAVLDALVPAVLEQRVTGAEAKRAWYGLLRAHGEPAPGPVAGMLRSSPRPETLARLPYYAFHPLGVEQRRAGLIRGIAKRAAWFEATTAMSPRDAATRLRSVPGIGPWTAAEVAVRALGDHDAVSVGDFHLPHLVTWALAREPRGDDDRMLDLLAPYAGRRALVIRLLETSGIRAPRYGPRLAPRGIQDL